MITISRRISILLFAFVMTIGTITGLAFFIRPKQSMLEKRELTAFPAFTLNSFLDGSYFSDISLWYADTFPGRDRLMSVNNSIASLNGVHPKTQVLSTAKADEIGQKQEEQEEEKKEPAKIPDTFALQEEIQGQITAGLLVQNGAAYGGYYFNQAACEQYVNAVNRAANELDGITNVYSILVPNNSAVMLDKETQEKLGGSDQKQAIEYYYSLYDKAKGISMIDEMIKNNDKLLYFKTDHHWSADGAYYAYKNFAKEKGFKPKSLSEYESKTFSPFYGSYLNEIGQGQLEADFVTVYVPTSTNEMMVYDTEGPIPTKEQLNEPGIPANIITLDDNLYDENNHYLRFILGDSGFKAIDNPKINDGSSVLVIKESYGNSFVPYLVDHYAKVYIADFRYCDIQIVTWCKENNVTDLILMNNIQLIANEGVTQWYDELLV